MHVEHSPATAVYCICLMYGMQHVQNADKDGYTLRLAITCDERHDNPALRNC